MPRGRRTYSESEIYGRILLVSRRVLADFDNRGRFHSCWREDWRTLLRSSGWMGTFSSITALSKNWGGARFRQTCKQYPLYPVRVFGGQIQKSSGNSTMPCVAASS